MRRIEQLINDVKFQTNEQSNRFSNEKFIKIFNDAQEEIVRIINVESSAPNFFQGNFQTDILANKTQYDLPPDVYADNSINAVIRFYQAGYGSPMKQISVRELGTSEGYFISDKSIVLSLNPVSRVINGLLVNYTRRLPRLAPRFGKVSLVAGQDITVAGFNAETDPTDYSDFICVVDKSGEIIDQGLEIVSYASGVFTLTGTITATTDHYIVMGQHATTHSQLPIECEKYLTMYCEKMVHYINSSPSDLNVASAFSEQDRMDISALFRDNESDVKYPPITDSTYLN